MRDFIESAYYFLGGVLSILSIIVYFLIPLFVASAPTVLITVFTVLILKSCGVI